MICSNCSNTIPDNAKFCPFCGASQLNREPEDETPKPELVFTSQKEQSGSFAEQAAEPDEQQENVSREPQASSGDPNTADRHTVYTSQGTQADYRPFSGMAIAGFVLAFIFPILGLIFSAIGMSQCRQNDYSGKGLAVAGLVLSIVFLVFWIILIGAAACVGGSSIFYVFERIL